MSSDIANYADDITPYECAVYTINYKKIWKWQFTKYLIGLSITNSDLMLLNFIFAYHPISLLKVEVVIRKNI